MYEYTLGDKSDKNKVAVLTFFFASAPDRYTVAFMQILSDLTGTELMSVSRLVEYLVAHVGDDTLRVLSGIILTMPFDKD